MSNNNTKPKVSSYEFRDFNRGPDDDYNGHTGMYVSKMLLEPEEHDEGLINLNKALDADIAEIMDRSKGTKHDTGKPKLSYVPVEAIAGISRALEYGANKYGKGNFKSGMDHTRVIDALLRHTYAYVGGEDVDQESGLSHLDHAGACVAILAYYKSRNVGKDDR